MAPSTSNPTELTVSDKLAPKRVPKVGMEKYQARFDELNEITDKLKAEKAPHQETHDRLVNDPALLAANKEIKRINAILGPLENERAALAKMLGGRSLSTGPKPE